MELGSYHKHNTSTSLQLARNHQRIASLALHQRHLHGKPLRNNTGKEIDPETGLYYFGARYLDPKTSRWISGDPAVGEYIPVAPVNEEARKRNGNLPGMGGVFNYVNLHVYHYAGNNPVKYTDPDGRLTQNEINRRNSLFTNIISSVNSWELKINTDRTINQQGIFHYLQGRISNEGLSLLRRIGQGMACAGGAINLRNEYRDRNIPVNPWAVDLKNGNEINYYRDRDGNIERDPNKLFEMLEIGDLLIYTNDDNPDGIKNGIWTGHTATVIGKTGDYVITAEFHEDGKDPTVTRLHKDILMWMNDTNLYGGARWND